MPGLVLFADGDSPMFSRAFFVVFVLLSLMLSCSKPPTFNDFIDSYIKAWIGFYPTSALAEGHVSSSERFENFSTKSIEQWVKYNNRAENVLKVMRPDLSAQEQVNCDVLLGEIRRELELWSYTPSHQEDPMVYATAIDQAVTVALNAQLEQRDVYQGVTARISSVAKMCKTAQKTLVSSPKIKGRQAVALIKDNAARFRGDLLKQLLERFPETSHQYLQELCEATAKELDTFATYLENELIPLSPKPNPLGSSLFKRGLSAVLFREVDLDQLMTKLDTTISELDTRQAALTREQTDSEQLNNDEINILVEDAYQFLVKEIPELERFPAPKVGPVFIPAGIFHKGIDNSTFIIPGPMSHANAIAYVSREVYPGKAFLYGSSRQQWLLLHQVFADPAFSQGWPIYASEWILDKGWQSNQEALWLITQERLQLAIHARASLGVHHQNWNKEDLRTWLENTKTDISPEKLWLHVHLKPYEGTTSTVGYWDLVDKDFVAVLKRGPIAESIGK